MKILIADSLDKKAVTLLADYGEVVQKPDLKAEDLQNELSDVDVLIVRSTKVTGEAILNAPILSLIIRAGSGVNTIALDAASKKGIYVANCPGKNTEAVAELAIGLLISADRGIHLASEELRCGIWNKKKYSKSSGLKGRTLGIIGYGAIGGALAQRAKSFGMKIAVWSRSMTPDRAASEGLIFCKTMEDVAAISDAVSVHLAYSKNLEHAIGARFFDAMKHGAIFINTSRGEIVDTDALKNAIKEKNLKAGLDVFENEPSAHENEFKDTELTQSVACTPHIGASTEQAAEAVAMEVAAIVREFSESGKPRNTVNVRQKSVTPCTLVVRHYDHIGALASILDALRDSKINIEEVENTIFEGAYSASCILKLDDVPDGAMIEKLQQNEEIIGIDLKK